LIGASFGLTAYMSGWLTSNEETSKESWFEAFFGGTQEWDLDAVLNEQFQEAGCYACEYIDAKFGSATDIRSGKASPMPADDWTRVIAVATDCRNRARRAIARATWVPDAR